jgi:SAM-dependent methyltransferase
MTSRQPVPEPGDALRELVAAIPAGGTALEIGSGPGRDAEVLEAQGITVRRADVTTDDLGGPYDAVLALAVLQHVERAQLPDVLGRVAAALRPGGVFLLSVRVGDGEQWEVGDSGNPCFTVLWREPDLCDLLEDADLDLVWRAEAEDSEKSHWLTFLVRRGR